MRASDTNPTVSDFTTARKPQNSVSHGGAAAPKSTTGFNFI